MSVQFSPTVAAQSRRIPGFTDLKFIDLQAMGVHASPLAVLDDFRVQDLPFSAHPHAGFAAATYVFEDSLGGVRSRTSTGVDLTIGPGGIVWTNAGRGIVHEEVPAKLGRELHGLQFFVNLTASHKLSEPRVLTLEGRHVPEWRDAMADRVRVIVGTFDGVSSPLIPDEPFTMLDVELRGSIPYTVEPTTTTVVYVLDGSLSIRSENEHKSITTMHALAITRGAATLVFESW
jgi:redox-sensitive bicupin YhaK (pirin superfamily)